ncbi:hypothetical protein [Rhodococcus olei]|uniref:hypothetical protein n=1 Tax=Rhodococcus olei TaxID=2161675 RepID=UPI0031EC8DDD
MVPAISRETLCRILRDGKVTWQATTTWKASTDPDLLTKMQAILDLYDRPPADGRVICVDEFGPLNLQPRKGKCWRPATHPAPTAGHLPPLRRCDAHARRARLDQRQNVLPHPATQTVR